jgi:hypothetical protein
MGSSSELHSIALRIIGINMDQHAITHPLLEAEFDTLTTERIASIGEHIRPYRSHIPTIEPDLYLFDRGKDLQSVSPGFSPLVDDHREKLNKETSNEDDAKGEKKWIHRITFHHFPV